MYNETNLTEKDRQAELAILKNSYQMYEKSKSDMLKQRGNKVDKDGNRIYTDKSITETLELMETMQQDIIDKFVQLGGTEEELRSNKNTKRSTSKKKLMELMETDYETEKHKVDKETLKYVMETKKAIDSEQGQMVLPKKNDKEKPFEAVNEQVAKSNTAFDLIPLPSNGECYRQKISKLPVSYLTAYDENMIVSPNLYKDGTFLDYILKAKIMSSAIDAGDLLPGDRDAIILWLRASGYGTEYPITTVDPLTNESFETTIDLSQIKYRPFNLKGDENGYFDFKLPLTGDIVKFKFLSYKEGLSLEEMDKKEKDNINHNKIVDYIKVLEEVVDEDNDIERATKIKLTSAIKEIKAYADTFGERDLDIFSHMITNKFAMSIIAVNGITDRKYINEYIMKMNVRDSSALRKYITDNEPGLDYNITVERPESLGGGSFNTFLQLDQFIFLTLPG